VSDAGTYFAADAELLDEERRLQLLAELFDPASISRLTRIGISPGWRCLEVGAGGGSIARWMADRVGSAGSVLATDLDTRLLSSLGARHIEVRTHDITNDGLEQGGYDLAHARSVLTHVSDPEAAARNMVRALRPGGWLLLEEPDTDTTMPVDPTHACAEVYTRLQNVASDFVRRSRILDPAFGRKVPGIIERLGLVETGNEVSGAIVMGATLRAGFWKTTASRLRTAMVASGATTETDWDAYHAAHEDPSFQYFEMSFIAGWGRKPL